MQQDDAISIDDPNSRHIGSLRKKTLLKGNATQRKQDLFFDFMTDLFDTSGSASNKFLERALVATDLAPNNANHFQ